MKKTLLFAVALVALTACKHKDLCYDYTHTAGLNVVFDWRKAPEASPKTMALYLFPTDGGPVQHYEFTNNRGGRIAIPAGSYDALCLNSDTESILFRGTDRRETFEAYTRDAALLASLGLLSSSVPRAKGTEDEPVVLAPDMLWSDRADRIEVVRSNTDQTFTFYPEESVCTYTVEIRNAENLQYVTGLSGSLSGMAGSHFLGTNQLSEQRSTIPFEASSDGESTVRGSFLTFGYHPQTASIHKLVIYAVLSDNSKWYYTYDVADQIHAAPDPRRVHIVLDGLPLPKPVPDGGAFQPGIDEWQPVDVEISM